MKNPRPSAFTLTELLISLSVLGIVAAIVIPRYVNVQSKANDAIAVQMADQLNSIYGAWKGSGGIVVTSGVPRATAYDLLWILSGSSASPITVTNGGTIVAADSLMSVGVRANVPGLPPLTDPSTSGVHAATVMAGSDAITFDSSLDQFAVANQETSSPSSSFPTISVTGSLAFPTIDSISTATRSFTISNTGTAPLIVNSVTDTYSGSWGSVVPYIWNWSSGTIAPGASQTVIVTFGPIAPGGGVYNTTISVNSNATSGTSAIGVSGRRDPVSGL